MSGALHLVARRNSRGENVLANVRAEGHSRISRMLRSESGAALAVTAQLGPGSLRGDTFTLDGALEERAQLTIAAQAATCIFGGTAPSRYAAQWSLGRGACLELHGAPLVAFEGSHYESHTRVKLAEDASALIIDVLTFAERGVTSVSICTFVRDGSRRLVHDIVRLRGDQLAVGEALGTLIVCGGTRTKAQLDRALQSLDEVIAQQGLRAGVGALQHGGILMRIVAPSAWDALEALHAARAALLSSCAQP